MNSPITRAEHEEFRKRMEDEHSRQNHRISVLEKTIEQNNQLLISVERLALSVENMQKELIDKGERLEVLESRDGDMWRKVVGYLVTTVLGILIGFVFKQIGI